MFLPLFRNLPGYACNVTHRLKLILSASVNKAKFRLGATCCDGLIHSFLLLYPHFNTAFSIHYKLYIFALKEATTVFLLLIILYRRIFKASQNLVKVYHVYFQIIDIFWVYQNLTYSHWKYIIQDDLSVVPVKVVATSMMCSYDNIFRLTCPTISLCDSSVISDCQTSLVKVFPGPNVKVVELLLQGVPTKRSLALSIKKWHSTTFWLISNPWIIQDHQVEQKLLKSIFLGTPCTS